MAWLGQWAKRKELSVLNSRIDASLTDFPVMVKISDASGANGQDITDILSDLSYLQAVDRDDDFTGENGSAPNPDKWIQSDANTTIQGNQLRCAITSATGSTAARAVWSLAGDFDIEVDWTMVTDPGAGQTEFALEVRIDSSNRLKLWYEAHSNLWRSRRFIGGASATIDFTEVINTGTQRKFRIARSGGNWTSYRWTGSSWVAMHSNQAIGSDTIPEEGARLYNNHYGTATTSAVDFDNFTVDNSTVIFEDFTGTDNDPPNSTNWNNALAGSVINSNRLRQITGSGPLRVESLFDIGGDFNYEIDYDIPSPSATEGWGFYFDFFIDGNNRCQVAVVHNASSPYYYYIANSWIAGVADPQSKNTNLSTKGKLRIRRVGSTLYMDHNDGQNYYNVATRTGFPTGSGMVRIRAAQWGTLPAVTCYWDNLVINSGSVTWPGGHPNRFKVAFTEDDGITELKAEVDQFESEDDPAFYHVALPAISNTVDTKFYIYYDRAQADNTANVGDIGSTPGQAVWDSNFVSVLHFKKGLGAADDIKDSTATEDLTSSGLTDADVLAALVGEGVLFGATTDVAASAAIAALQIDGDVSIESIVKRTNVSLANTGYICECGASGESLITNLLYSLYFRADNYLSVFWEYGAGGANEVVASTTLAIADTTNFHYVAAVRDNSAKQVDFYLDAGNQNVGYTNDPQKDTAGNLQALRLGNNLNGNRPVDALIDEFRLSNIERPAAWIKATRFTLIDDIFDVIKTESIPYEDLTTYTEVDTQSRLTVGTYDVLATALQKGDVAYLYKDFGAGFFGDFEINFEIEISSSASGDSMLCMLALGDTPGTWQDMNATDDGIIGYVINNAGSLLLIEWDFVTPASGNGGVIPPASTTLVKRYGTFDRSGSTVRLRLFSDQERTTQISIAQNTGFTTQAFRYLMAANSYDDPGSAAISGKIQNIEIISPLVPTAAARLFNTEVIHSSLFGGAIVR